MAHDFIPRRDEAFRHWSGSFSARINETPEAFGVTPQQAADYANLNDAYAAALLVTWDPAMRTKVSVGEKNAARRNAEREARRLARLIQATASVSDTQKRRLGLTVRDTQPTRVPVPTQPPSLLVKLRYGSTIRVTLRSKDSTLRRKPQGVAGAIVLSYVGNKMPDDASKWTLAGNTTRPRIDVTLTGNDLAPGAKVWITAYWYNSRAQPGPAARPKYTFIQCPTVWLQKDELRQAA